MIKDLYYSKKEEKYYYNGFKSCDKCLRIVDNLLFIERIFNKKSKYIYYYCKSCILKRAIIPNIYEEILICSVVDSLPRDAFPIFDSPPGLANMRGEDVFFIAQNNQDGERVKDRAIQSHNPQFMQMSKVKSLDQLETDVKVIDKKIKLEDLDEEFNNIINSVSVSSRFSDEEEVKKIDEVKK